jgi:hypothetical protein
MIPFETYLKTTIDCWRENITTTEKTIEELTNKVDELNKVFDPLDLKGTKYKTEILEHRLWMEIGANTIRQALLRNLETMEWLYKAENEKSAEE